MRIAKLLLLVAMASLTGCFNHANSSDDGPNGPHRKIQSDTACCIGTWEWSVDNGDKPGIGLRFVGEGADLKGTFFLLDPSHEHDFNAAGQIDPLDDLRKTGTVITFTIRLASGSGSYVEHMILRLESDLMGQVGDQVKGRMDSKERPESPFDVVLLRRK